jgi:sortase A
MSTTRRTRRAMAAKRCSGAPRKAIGGVRVVLGVALVWGALGILGYRLGWEAHSHDAREALLNSARAGSVRRGDSTCSRSVQGTPTEDGQLSGVLDIPRLQVVAPVEQGTGDDVLDVAVGHADATPLPGTPGTSVLLAHDVSYFADIDKLSAGDLLDYEVGCLTYEFEVTGHEIVQAGAATPQLSGTGLVLDTCWPTNALWYTPNRYLVDATETRVVASSKAVGRSSPKGSAPKSWVTGYSAPAPPALAAQGLDLTQNEEPMGTLALTGAPSEAWVQSPAPLAVEAAALEGYFGALHSADEGRSDWWAELAPGVTMPGALDGAFVSAHDAPLDVTIAAQGDRPTSVVLDTEVTLSGGNAPGEYTESVTEAVHGLTVLITNWEVDDA